MDVPVECSWASGRASRPNRYVELLVAAGGVVSTSSTTRPVVSTGSTSRRASVVSTGSTTRGPRGLDGLDHPSCGLDGVYHLGARRLDKLDHPAPISGQSLRSLTNRTEWSADFRSTSVARP